MQRQRWQEGKKRNGTELHKLGCPRLLLFIIILILQRLVLCVCLSYWKSTSLHLFCFLSFLFPPVQHALLRTTKLLRYLRYRSSRKETKQGEVVREVDGIRKRKQTLTRERGRERESSGGRCGIVDMHGR